MQSEVGIRQLPKKDQAYFRQVAANNLQKLINKHQTEANTNDSYQNIQEWKIMKGIKQKIELNHLTITKTHKGNTTVILKTNDYNMKIDEFIKSNKFTTLTHDIMTTLQKKVRNYLNTSKHVINKDEKWKFVNMNPRATKIHATVKLHKRGNPIRPIVTLKECPIYKLVKALSKILHNKLELPNAFNVTNSRSLSQELASKKGDEHTQLCSLDIENMYTNIPISDLPNIISSIITRNNVTTKGECTEIMNLL
jgi:hypothetical protein